MLRLGAVLREAYEQAAYDLRIDYAAAPPPPPRNDADRDWLAATLSRCR